jgi:hypothetical protein
MCGLRRPPPLAAREGLSTRRNAALLRGPPRTPRQLNSNGWKRGRAERPSQRAIPSDGTPFWTSQPRENEAAAAAVAVAVVAVVAAAAAVVVVAVVAVEVALGGAMLAAAAPERKTRGRSGTQLANRRWLRPRTGRSPRTRNALDHRAVRVSRTAVRVRVGVDLLGGHGAALPLLKARPTGRPAITPHINPPASLTSWCPNSWPRLPRRELRVWLARTVAP